MIVACILAAATMHVYFKHYTVVSKLRYVLSETFKNEREYYPIVDDALSTLTRKNFLAQARPSGLVAPLTPRLNTESTTRILSEKSSNDAITVIYLLRKQLKLHTLLLDILWGNLIKLRYSVTINRIKTQLSYSGHPPDVRSELETALSLLTKLRTHANESSISVYSNEFKQFISVNEILATANTSDIAVFRKIAKLV